MAAYEAGEFERAAELLDEAEAAGGFSRDDLVEVLEHRVLLARALGDEPTAERSMLRLVTLAPDALAGAAPDIVRARDAAVSRCGGATLELELEHEQVEGATRVRPRVRGDTGGLVSAVELRVRARGEGWSEPSADAITVDAAPDEVEAVAHAIGPGGAVVASIGTLEAPALLQRAPLAPLESDPVGDDTALHVGLAIAAVLVVVAAGAVAVGVGVSGGQPESLLGEPMVRW